MPQQVKALVVAVLILAAGCSVSAGPPDGEAAPTTVAPSTTAEPVTTTTEVAVTSTSVVPGPLSLGDLPGLLAVTDPTGRLVVVQPDGFEATLVDGGDDTIATQPVWSPDGENLAWSSAGPRARTVAVERLGTGERLDIDAPGPPAFYIQWNPASDELLYLRGSVTSDQVEVWAGTPGRPATFVERGAPTFLSWAPAADRWITHIDNEELTVRDAAESPSVQVTATDGGFGAPDWIDDTVVIGVIDEQLALIDVESGRVIEALGPEVSAEPFRGVRFVFNRTSGAVAYQLVGDESGLMVRTAAGVDIEIDGADVPAAWEWSPDGARLAWLEQVGDGIEVRWHFWDLEREEELAVTPAFALSRRDARDYLPFFAQFAQSHRRWSPDGLGFAYAGATGDGAGIWVQLIDDDPAPPTLVSSGDSVTWSPTGGSGAARTRV